MGKAIVGVIKSIFLLVIFSSRTSLYLAIPALVWQYVWPNRSVFGVPRGFVVVRLLSLISSRDISLRLTSKAKLRADDYIMYREISSDQGLSSLIFWYINCCKVVRWFSYVAEYEKV